MKTAHDTLVAARALIANPENWTQGVLARDDGGFKVNPLAQEACCFCADGALIRAAGGDENDAYNEAFAALADVVPEGTVSIVHINDRKVPGAHAAVLTMFDLAIGDLAGVAA